MLNVNKTVENGVAKYALSGWLDTTTAPALETDLKESLEGVTDLTFDLKELEYVSSAGLRVILSAQKIMNKQGEMRICNVCESVMEIFEITGFVDILDIV